MTKPFAAALMLLLACPRPAESHRLDEYLQATRIALAGDRIVLEIDLTPGVAVAARVFALIDRDGDQHVTGLEIEGYARQILQDLVLRLDDHAYPLALARAECPSWAEIRDGAGTIRLQAVAKAPLGSGPHRLHYENRHQRAIGLYLVNALMPSSRAIAITAQQRDVRQHGIEMEIDVAAAYRTAPWIILQVVGLAALLGYRSRSGFRGSEVPGFRSSEVPPFQNSGSGGLRRSTSAARTGGRSSRLTHRTLRADS